MIALALGLGVLGLFAFRHARRHCMTDGYGWYAPWYGGAYADEDGGCGHDEHRGHRGHRRRRDRGPWRMRRWMLHRALSRLDATPAQERVIVGEIDKLRDRVRDARAGLRDVRGDLAAAVRGPALDDAALGAVLGHVDRATAEMRGAAVEALRNIHGVLDERQRAELAAMLEDGMSRGGGGWRVGPYR